MIGGFFARHVRRCPSDFGKTGPLNSALLDNWRCILANILYQYLDYVNMNTNLLLHFNLWNPLQQVAGVIRVNKPSFPIMHSLLSYNIVEGISNAEDASYCWHIGKSLILATLILTPSDLNSEVFHFLVHFSPFYSIYYNIYTFWGFET